MSQEVFTRYSSPITRHSFYNGTRRVDERGLSVRASFARSLDDVARIPRREHAARRRRGRGALLLRRDEERVVVGVEAGDADVNLRRVDRLVGGQTPHVNDP